MDALHPVLQAHTGLLVLLCALIFRVVHRLLCALPAPKLVRQDAFRSWKWRNLSVSIVHSLLTGVWALTCAVIWPETLYKIQTFYTPLSHLLVCVSTGYFIQDASDILMSGYAKGSWEFLLHHALVICCFSYTLYTQQCISGAVMALFVEVNSITLHLRMILKLASAQSSFVYHINKLVNIFTYITFRLGTQFYLTWFLVINFSEIVHAEYLLTGLMMMNVMMLIYFYRLLRADFFQRRKSYVAQNGTFNTKKFLND
ncbi:TLC domain-containing protein 1 [Thalassophryne amazonica]|uniref:TLC domain-containing protein 1 n=1 Tax=Thalassophryne amazonica TaxID=390379 RepID=UPI001471D81D|nr:TLC domain-containing protein 1 [Thalassophryne amazonica]